MKRIKLYRHLLKSDGHIYLDSNGYLDILGQCLTQLGHNCEGNHRIPSDLGKHIHPFTIQLRHRIVDTHLTQEILKLDYLPRDKRLEVAKKLLAPFFNVELYL